MRQHRLERPSALLQPPHVLLLSLAETLYIAGGGGRREGGGGVVVVPDIAAVDDEDDGVAHGVVARPHGAQRVLAADVPDLEVHVRQGDGGDVLADGRDGRFAGGRGLVVEGFDGGEQRRFPGVVEA